MESLRFDPDVEVAAFRIVQEAIQNALRHGGAAHIHVTLGYEDKTLRLAIVDDGAGFDVQKAVGQGLGLVSMRERASAVRGNLHITSRRGETRVEARIPAPVPKPDARDSGS
jgi:signal transduction histidine kinase